MHPGTLVFTTPERSFSGGPFLGAGGVASHPELSRAVPFSGVYKANKKTAGAERMLRSLWKRKGVCRGKGQLCLSGGVLWGAAVLEHCPKGVSTYGALSVARDARRGAKPGRGEELA